MKQITLVLIFMFLFCSSGIACQFDTDCGIGSRCIKEAGDIYGICVGGLNQETVTTATQQSRQQQISTGLMAILASLILIVALDLYM